MCPVAQGSGSSPPEEVIALSGQSGYVPWAGRWPWGAEASPGTSSAQAGYHPPNPVLDQDPVPSSWLQSHRPTCPLSSRVPPAPGQAGEEPPTLWCSPHSGVLPCSTVGPSIIPPQ